MQAGDNYEEVRTNLVTGIQKLQESMAERLQVASKQSTWTRAWCCSGTLCGFAQNVAILQNGMRFEPISGFGTSSRGWVARAGFGKVLWTVLAVQGKVGGNFWTGSDMVLVRFQIRFNVLALIWECHLSFCLKSSAQRLLLSELFQWCESRFVGAEDGDVALFQQIEAITLELDFQEVQQLSIDQAWLCWG